MRSRRESLELAGIIAVAGQKGGGGETTTAISIAVVAQARGRRVLLVDADPQGSIRMWGSVAAELGHATPPVHAFALEEEPARQLEQLDELVKASPASSATISRYPTPARSVMTLDTARV